MSFKPLKGQSETAVPHPAGGAGGTVWWAVTGINTNSSKRGSIHKYMMPLKYLNDSNKVA